jgi:hypothetical protein
MLWRFLEHAYSKLDRPWSVQASTSAPAPIRSRTTASLPAELAIINGVHLNTKTHLNYQNRKSNKELGMVKKLPNFVFQKDQSVNQMIWPPFYTVFGHLITSSVFKQWLEYQTFKIKAGN